MALSLGEDHDLAVASVLAPKGGAEEESEAPQEPGAAAAEEGGDED